MFAFCMSTSLLQPRVSALEITNKIQDQLTVIKTVYLASVLTGNYAYTGHKVHIYNRNIPLLVWSTLK